MAEQTSAGGLLITGGSGRLGRELVRLLPHAQAPSSRELDVTDEDATLAVVAALRPSAVVHAAGYTDVRGAEQDRQRCWRVNVAGTRHVAAAARDWCAPGARLHRLRLLRGPRQLP